MIYYNSFEEQSSSNSMNAISLSIKIPPPLEKKGEGGDFILNFTGFKGALPL